MIEIWHFFGNIWSLLGVARQAQTTSFGGNNFPWNCHFKYFRKQASTSWWKDHLPLFVGFPYLEQSDNYLHCICCQAKYFCQGLLWHATWYVFACEQYPLGQLIFEVSKLNMSSHTIYLCILQWWCVSLFWVSSCWFLAWKLEKTQETNHKISPHIFIFHWYHIHCGESRWRDSQKVVICKGPW